MWVTPFSAARVLVRSSSICSGARPSNRELVDDLAVDAARAAHGLEVDVAACHRPLVQAVPAVTTAVVRSLIGTGDEPVEGHGHVENGCGHAFPFLASGHTGR